MFFSRYLYIGFLCGLFSSYIVKRLNIRLNWFELRLAKDKILVDQGYGFSESIMLHFAENKLCKKKTLI